MNETLSTPFSSLVNKRSDSFRQQEELRHRTSLTETAKAKQREKQEQKRKKLIIKLGATALAAFTTVYLLGTMSKDSSERSEPRPSTAVQEPIEHTTDYEPEDVYIIPPKVEHPEPAAIVPEAQPPAQPATTPAEIPTEARVETSREQDEIAAKVANFSEEAWEKWSANDLDLTESDTRNMISTYEALLNHSEAEGLSEAHIAGIMGNMFQENRFRTSDGNPSMGLIQWTGPRKVELYSFASANNLDPESVQTQVSFMFYERHHATGEDARWETFLESHTVDEATRSFCEEVERAGTPNIDARLAYGRTIADFMDIDQ